MIKKVKKRPFTLLEVLLSLSLVSFLLFFFFGHLKTSVKLKNKISQAQSIAYKRAYIQQRLSDLFSKIEPAIHDMKDSGEMIFYSEKTDSLTTLNFVFDGGVDKDIDFCGPLKAKLYLSANSALVLDIFPLHEPSSKKREETLMEHVQSLTIEFYAMPKPHDKDTTNILLAYEKKTQWMATNDNLPAIVRVNILYKRPSSQKMETITYSFFPNSKIKEITFEN